MRRARRLSSRATRQQYGRPEYLPVDERHPLRPIDINGIHKVAAEAYHLLYGRLYGLRTDIASAHQYVRARPAHAP